MLNQGSPSLAGLARRTGCVMVMNFPPLTLVLSIYFARPKRHRGFQPEITRRIISCCCPSAGLAVRG